MISVLVNLTSGIGPQDRCREQIPPRTSRLDLDPEQRSLLAVLEFYILIMAGHKFYI